MPVILFPHMTNLIDASATVLSTSGGTVPTGMEATNLADPDLSLVWRNTSISTTRFVKIDLGSALPVRAVGIIGSNDSSSGTGLKIQGDEDSAFASIDADSGAFHPTSSAIVDPGGWPFMLNGYHDFGSNQTYRYWRVIVDDTGNSDGYYQLRRLLFGTAFKPADDFTVQPSPPQISLEDSSLVVTMRSGNDVDFGGVRRRRHRFTLDRLTEAEFQQLLDWCARRGTGGDLCFLADETADEETWSFEGLYGRLASMPTWEFYSLNQSRRYYRVTLDIIERTTG